MLAYHLRPATEDDLALTYAITEAAMRGYVEQTWGRWEPEQQRHLHRQRYTPHTHRIVLIGDPPEVAGLVAIEDEPTHLQLAKLYLLPARRDQGLGTRLLQHVQQLARERAVPLRLRVLRVNTGAQRLYLRHGFRVVEETPERLFMEWRA